MTAMQKALTVLVRVATAILAVAAFVAAVLVCCEVDGACKLWRARYTACEQPGCKDRLAEDRPFACSVERP